MSFFRLLERMLVVRRGDGAVAAQAYGIAGAVGVGDVLEGEPGGVAERGNRLGGHELASFSAAGGPTTLFGVYALHLGKLLGIGASRIERWLDLTSTRGDP